MVRDPKVGRDPKVEKCWSGYDDVYEIFVYDTPNIVVLVLGSL